MAQLELPFDGTEKFERINPDAQEINIAQLLSCSRRTINSYIEKGILPKPISEKDGILYFSKDGVIAALGLKNLDELLIDIKEAAKLLNIAVPTLERYIEEGRFTEIKLKGLIKSKRWYIKREIEECQIEIETINSPRDYRNDKRFIELFFTPSGIKTLELILSKQEVDILKKVIEDKIDYVDIGNEYNLTSERIRQIFNNAIMRLRSRLKNIYPLIKKNALKDIEKNYYYRFQELEEKLVHLNNLIKDAEDKIDVPENLQNIEVQEYLEISQQEKFLKTKVIDYDLSVRVLNGLKAMGVKTINDLVSYEPSGFFKHRNFGRRCLSELKEFVESHGLKLGMFEAVDKELKKKVKNIYFQESVNNSNGLPSFVRIKGTKKKVHQKKKKYVHQKLQQIEVSGEFRNWDNKKYQLLNTNVFDYDLSVEALNCLEAMDIKTVKQLVTTEPSEFLEHPNFDKKCMDELEVFVKSLELRFGMDLTGMHRPGNYE